MDRRGECSGGPVCRSNLQDAFHSVSDRVLSNGPVRWYEDSMTQFGVFHVRADSAASRQIHIDPPACRYRELGTKS